MSSYSVSCYVFSVYIDYLQLQFEHNFTFVEFYLNISPFLWNRCFLFSDLQSSRINIIPWPNGGFVKNIHDGDGYCNSFVTRRFSKKVGMLVMREGVL
jgi:hypothetical protein